MTILTMSSSHVIIIRGHIDKEMITLGTTVHFDAGTRMHSAMNL